MTLDLDDIRHPADADGHRKAAVVPIDVWRAIESEIETRYLLDNPRHAGPPAPLSRLDRGDPASRRLMRVRDERARSWGEESTRIRLATPFTPPSSGDRLLVIQH